MKNKPSEEWKLKKYYEIYKERGGRVSRWPRNYRAVDWLTDTCLDVLDASRKVSRKLVGVGRRAHRKDSMKRRPSEDQFKESER